MLSNTTQYELHLLFVDLLCSGRDEGSKFHAGKFCSMRINWKQSSRGGIALNALGYACFEKGSLVCLLIKNVLTVPKFVQSCPATLVRKETPVSRVEQTINTDISGIGDSLLVTTKFPTETQKVNLCKTGGLIRATVEFRCGAIQVTIMANTVGFE